MTNATIERPADVTVETEITKAIRAQQADLPNETARLERRIVQLRADRDPAHQAVIELRIKVRAGLAKQGELDRALTALEQIDNEIHSTEIAFEDLASSQRVLTLELEEQLKRRRATVAPALTANARQRIAAITAWLAEGEQLVNALRDLAPAVAQFERGHTPYGHTVFHRELPEGVVRAVNFFTDEYRGGASVAGLRERWTPIAESVK